MARRLFTLASALSLILCLAIVALWVRSYWRTTFAVRYSRLFDGDGLHTHQVELRRGRVLLIHSDWERGGDAKCEYEFHDCSPREWDDGYDAKWRVFGFGCGSYENPPDMNTYSEQVASVPCWFLFGSTLAGTIYLMRRGRARARVAGACVRCGYDLRASPDRCPECGHVPERATT